MEVIEVSTGNVVQFGTGKSTTKVDMDAALADLIEGEARWADITLSGRASLLKQVSTLMIAHADEWVATAAAIKGLDTKSPLLGEEWTSGPYPIVAACTALSATLEKLAIGQSPVADVSFGTAPGNRTTVQVLPLNFFDKLLLNGFSAQVWLKPGIDRATAKRTAGLAQLDPRRTHGVGVVLGAGNITSIAPLDAFYELFAHNRVVALKLNPIMDPMLGVMTNVLAPLIDAGALRLLTGAAEEGTYLVHHESVNHVHITGSSTTHDAIVFGGGHEGARRKKDNESTLAKEISSELGGVSPTIVLPGKWTAADIKYQAEHIATQRLHNGGYNCVAAQVVVLSSKWTQRNEFIGALRSALDSAPAREPYYPGSGARISNAAASYPQAERLGNAGARLLVANLSPEQYEPMLRTEYFAPVLSTIELPHDGAEFASRAARLVNDDFVGTLGVNVIAQPATIKSMGASFDRFVESLRYGTVAINAWTGVAYLTATATWGAFPGHELADVQSGIGVVHNALLIGDTERTVVRGPFRPSPRSLMNGEMSIAPKPPWFVTNRTAATTGRLLALFTAAPSWRKLPALFASALRG
jgi:aldehyde dehydrogenase (NAD(P)+)